MKQHTNTTTFKTRRWYMTPRLTLASSLRRQRKTAKCWNIANLKYEPAANKNKTDRRVGISIYRPKPFCDLAIAHFQYKTDQNISHRSNTPTKETLHHHGSIILLWSYGTTLRRWIWFWTHWNSGTHNARHRKQVYLKPVFQSHSPQEKPRFLLKVGNQLGLKD